MKLFNNGDTFNPLAERMKPQSFEDFVGQEHILGKGKLLRNLVEKDLLKSIILYGPPGSGKTSIAKIISNITKANFETINAVVDGIKELKEVINKAKKNLEIYNKKTIVFIDEIHRFNKIQQDGLLPAVEKGYIILIGATTFNPYFYIIPALLSRTTIFKLNTLSFDELKKILNNALTSKNKGLGNEKIEIDEDVKNFLIIQSNGDARKLLNFLEFALLNTTFNTNGVKKITLDTIKEISQIRTINYDRDGDFHYDIISAFIKSMRGSDVNAALYYLAWMLEAGEDIRFIARRCAIFAAEDIGLAEPFALVLAQSAYDLIEKIGLPESNLILSMLVSFLALTPKSNSTTKAIELASKYIKNEKNFSIPKHLRDSHYSGAKNFGHGQGYKYPHDYENHWVKQNYLEKDLNFFNPTKQGKEKKMFKYFEWINNLKRID